MYIVKYMVYIYIYIIICLYIVQSTSLDSVMFAGHQIGVLNNYFFITNIANVIFIVIFSVKMYILSK